MKRAFLIAAALAAGWGSSVAAEPPSVATWNVRNLALVDRYEEESFRLAWPMPETRKQAIRACLLEARPSVLFLQEVGSAAFLEELRLDLAADGLDYPFSAFSGLPGNRAGLAVLSMYPFQEVIFHHPLETKTATPLRRGLQEVAVRVQATLFRFFHVHLKSRYSADPRDPDARQARMAELAALQDFLMQQLISRPSTSLVLLGDFNTPFPDPLLNPLREAWQPLPATDSAGASWTYFHHRSQSREQLDGFWFPRSRPAPLLPASLLPASASPSDHRLLLAPLFFP